MTNQEKFKTPEEQAIAFCEHCKKCPDYGECVTFNRDLNNTAHHERTIVCATKWLALEAEEEKPEPCPFCGGETHSNLGHLKVGVVHYWVDCISPDCMYRSAHYTDKNTAIAAHNRVTRAVKAAKESEMAK